MISTDGGASLEEPSGGSNRKLFLAWLPLTDAK